MKYQSRRLRRFFLTLLLIAAPALSFADTPDIDISLVSIGPGAPIYVWFGHTAFVITDHASGREYFINFGLVDFSAEEFYLNFVLGKLFFMVGASDSNWEIRNYQAQDRFITRQYLNLTDSQKNELYGLIRESLKKENRVYRYDHYYDNCATKPRDLLDKTLDGALRAANEGPSGLSIREQTRRYTQNHPFVQWWLMYGQGGVIDGEASVWDSMFLPLEFHNAVARVPGLVEREETLYEKDLDIPDRPENLRYLLYPFLAGMLLIPLPLAARRWKRIKSLSLISSVYEQILLALIGLLGAILLFLIFFTEHTVVAYNFNALLNPVVTLVPLFLPGKLRLKSRRFTWSVLWGIAAVMTLIQPVFVHKNLNIILFFLPVYTVLGGIPLIKSVLKRFKTRSMLKTA